MAITGEGVCKGCGARRGTGHCKFPSNPAVDARAELKSAPKSDDKVCRERRERANKLSQQNKY